MPKDNKELKQDDQQQQQLVTMTKEQFDGIMVRISKLETPSFEIPQYITEHVATVVYYKGKPIIKFGGVKQDPETGDMVLAVYTGEKKELVPYHQFIDGSAENVERYKAKIVEKKRQEVQKDQNMVNPVIAKVNPDPAGIGGKGVFAPGYIRLTETIVVEIDIVEILEGEFKGQQLELDVKVLNR